MTTKLNKHVGKNFDDYLKEKGRLEQSETVAIKRVIAYLLDKEMKKKHITQTEVAARLKTSRTAVKRLLDPENYSMTLLNLVKVAHVLGKNLEITFTDIKK